MGRTHKIWTVTLLLALSWSCADDPPVPSDAEEEASNNASMPDAQGEDAEEPDLARPDLSDTSETPDLPTDMEDMDASDTDLTETEDEPDLPERVCETGEISCRAQGTLVCSEEGQWEEGDCPEDRLCLSDACVPVICEPQEAECDGQEILVVCNSNGTVSERYPCPEGTVCQNSYCVSTCTPGALSCLGNEVRRCLEGGLEWEVIETCDSARGIVCQEGECTSSCSVAADKGGYIGCDYWGVDTPNEFGLRNQFAYVVSNVSSTDTAFVTVETAGGEMIAEAEVAPLQVETLIMPHPRDMNVNASGITNNGFRITSSVPINAYQFNPLQRFDNAQGISVASNDASLLLPDSALGTEYIGASFTHWREYASFLSIVSTEDNNLVTIVPGAVVAPSINQGEPFARLNEGEEYQFTLHRGQVLTLKTFTAGSDLTGTTISSQENVGVFGGHDCAMIPVGTSFCDHIEEKLFPVRAWDNEYYAARFKARAQEFDVWRVVASVDGTTITTDPPQGTIPVLNRGEYFEFNSTENFKVSADHPIMLVQYMTGSGMNPGLNDGDPSMLLSVPARQFLREYVFLVPETYNLDWITVIHPTNVAVVLDGEALFLGDAELIGDSGFAVSRVFVSDGRHELISDQPVGVSVYGYDHNISYAYPAGLNLAAWPTADE